jgi:ferredoxin
MGECHSEWLAADDAPHSEALTMAMEKRHMKEGRSVLECTCSVSGTAKVTEVRISPANVYSILANSLKTREVCAK